MCDSKNILPILAIGAIGAATGGFGLLGAGAAAGAAGAGAAAAGTAATVGTTAAAAGSSSLLTGLSLAGTAATAVGQIQKGQAESQMDAYNANVASQRATDALAVGSAQEDQQRNKGRQIEGQQTATMGASGAVAGSGSFGNVLDQTATYGELDAQTIRANALKQAWGLQGQATGDSLAGSFAKQGSLYGAAGSLLNGSVQAYGVSRNWGRS